MPLITAEKIHDGKQWLPQGTVIEVAEDGTIIALHDNADNKDVIVYEGILAPGFVNVHCHLELSHMKGVVPEHTGLIPFLQNIPQHRNDFTDGQKKLARHDVYNELLKNGVVAVGDIANVTDTLDVRALDKLHVHTFIESIGFTQTPQRQFGFSEQTYNAFAAQATGSKLLRQSIVPHAPYSVSHELFSLIDKHNEKALISIHNQESHAEDEYYLMKEGPVQNLLHGLGIDDAFFSPSGKSSLQTYLQWLSPSHPMILVHNTYTTRTDIDIAKSLLPNVYWCFCPNANQYIENALPDIGLFIQEHATICIGTDSLASNHQLSILSELETIKKHYPHISWETLLQWGTSNGAQALQMQDVVGCIAPDMRPGIVQLSGMESANDSVDMNVIVAA